MYKFSSKFDKRAARVRRQLRTRSNGALVISVAKSNRNIYLQLIDHSEGRTVCSASTLSSDFVDFLSSKDVVCPISVNKTSSKQSRTNMDYARNIGKYFAMRLKSVDAIDINKRKFVFDRGGYLYHGVVKALADSIREEGIAF